MSDDSDSNGNQAERRRQRATLGASMLLFAPLLFIFVALLLADSSRDSDTSADVYWSFVLAFIGICGLVAGGVLWLRNR